MWISSKAEIECFANRIERKQAPFLGRIVHHFSKEPTIQCHIPFCNLFATLLATMALKMDSSRPRKTKETIRMTFVNSFQRKAEQSPNELRCLEKLDFSSTLLFFLGRVFFWGLFFCVFSFLVFSPILFFICLLVFFFVFCFLWSRIFARMNRFAILFVSVLVFFVVCLCAVEEQSSRESKKAERRLVDLREEEEEPLVVMKADGTMCVKKPSPNNATALERARSDGEEKTPRAYCSYGCSYCSDFCWRYGGYYCCDGSWCCCYDTPGSCDRNSYCQTTTCG